MNVANRKRVFSLGLRSLKANRTRNLVAALAIALTAMLFTSLFTIAFSINEGFQQTTFRQVGSSSHGGFKYLTEEQYNELKDDPRIAQSGLRRFLGMPTDVPFNKSHVEVSYADAQYAHWMFCDPVVGRLPQEGTNEAATDTKVLRLLGIEPELGAEFTVTFPVDGHETTQVFTLCGWWEADDAIIANHILIPESRVNAILREVGVTPPGRDSMTGSWNMDVTLKSGTRHIRADFDAILRDHGYQSDTPAAEGYIDSGVNWAYTGAQLSENLDLPTILLLAGMLILILLTGYLIIYNVFQISVAGDIRFYGLLKTIGTTPRQLWRVIRAQALMLSLAGIPVGLLLGWLLGGVLTPVVTARLNSVAAVTSADPRLFIGSALFALITVFLSCRRPGRMASRVSPIEAVRYTEGASPTGRKAARRRAKKVSLLSMAWANLGRSRGKTAVTVLSLSLAVVLLTTTVTLSRGFDMDKYLAMFVSSDFLVANAGQFQTNQELFSPELALPQSAIDAINARGGITEGGRIYGKASPVEEFVTEDYYRQARSWWPDPDGLNARINAMERNSDGLLAADAQLYGMESFALDRLTVLEGDLSKLSDPDGRYIAAVYSEDDYGEALMDSHWAKLGDTVTLRYVERYEYYDPATGEVFPEGTDLSGVNWQRRAAEYRDVAYTVAALVSVPTAFSYRYYGDDEFVLGAQTFLRDSGTDSVMYYAFNTQDDAAADMESFLKTYTENDAPELDYESRATYTAEFDSVRSMFSLLGGTLSAIVGLVGILNFANAIITGISARRRELAVLRSVGMTARQLRTMLMLEGLLYTLGAVTLALLLMLLTAPAMNAVLGNLFWFLSYHFTLWPVLAAIPVFAALGSLIPVLSGRAEARRSIVERLRQE